MAYPLYTYFTKTTNPISSSNTVILADPLSSQSWATGSYVRLKWTINLGSIVTSTITTYSLSYIEIKTNSGVTSFYDCHYVTNT